MVFFFQAEDGIRDIGVTGVQTCALPILSHRGRVTVVEAKLYSRPESPPPLLGAAVTEATAEAVGAWADGLLTVSAFPDQMRRVIEAVRRGGGGGKRAGGAGRVKWGPTAGGGLAGARAQ